jgi:ABC-type glycerol-3-phosphate transport system substrate-binding protein
MNRSRLRGAVGALLVAGLALATAACGDDEEQPAADGKVAITVNGLPPKSEAVERERFMADVAAFQKAYPNITVTPKEGKMDPQTFQTKLAGGQLEDVFYTYFTDPAGLIQRRQVAEITPYLDDFAAIKNIKPELMKVYSDDSGKVYGLPTQNYSMGLIYNRELFQRAGLDPNTPPKTWAEVREYAKKISALGNGIVGYGDYSKSNTGGWHFTAETFSLGGDVAVQDGDSWKASFNNDKGRQVLQQLKDMRWTDNSMGARQQLEWADLLQMMGSGKLGMYVATGDNLPIIVGQYKGDYTKYGLGPMPGGEGTLAGGEGYMFNAKATPAKIKAGLTWLMFKFNDPERIETYFKFNSDKKLPVGLPEPNIWTGAPADTREEVVAKYANMPSENYAAFEQSIGQVPLKLEPPNAQQIYAVLDVAMQKVLTDRNANVDQLLNDAEKQVNTILASVE